MHGSKALSFVFALAALSSWSQYAIQWQRVLGSNADDLGKSVAQTPDGGYLVAGELGGPGLTTTCAYPGSGAWVIKLDSQGEVVWERCLGGSGADRFNDLVLTSDGGALLVGETWSNNGDAVGHHGMGDVWVVKLNTTGGLEWQRCFGGANEESGRGITKSSDGGYVVVGKSRSADGDLNGNNGSDDLWVIKLNSEGDLVWQRNLGGSDSDDAQAVCETDDGNFVAVGRTASDNGDVSGHFNQFDLWAVKLDNNGDLIWQSCLGGTHWDIGYSVIPEDNGGCLVAGLTFSNNGAVSGNNGPVNMGWGTADNWLVRIDGDGSMSEQKCIGGSSNDKGYSLSPMSDGYLIAGETGSDDGFASPVFGAEDFSLVKVGADLDLQWQFSLGGSFFDVAYSAQETADGGIIVTGYSQSSDGQVAGNLGEKDLWLVKLRPIGTAVDPPSAPHVTMLPNPANTFVQLVVDQPGRVLRVFNTQGRILVDSRMDGTHYNLDLARWPKGLYVVQVHSALGTFNKRLVVH
ncbi:MAG: T9SS type A sorting domain-containing protein [Flavobacteriales bacterium]|nr:T9SS type A sorting domain-containing protein [Flavobacteriales bacterium]